MYNELRSHRWIDLHICSIALLRMLPLSLPILSFFYQNVLILWRRKWQPTPVLLPGKSHGWRSLVGYSPRGRKELDRTERLHFVLRMLPLSSPILSFFFSTRMSLFYARILYYVNLNYPSMSIWNIISSE